MRVMADGISPILWIVSSLPSGSTTAETINLQAFVLSSEAPSVGPNLALGGTTGSEIIAISSVPGGDVYAIVVEPSNTTTTIAGGKAKVVKVSGRNDGSMPSEVGYLGLVSDINSSCAAIASYADGSIRAFLAASKLDFGTTVSTYPATYAIQPDVVNTSAMPFCTVIKDSFVYTVASTSGGPMQTRITDASGSQTSFDSVAGPFMKSSKQDLALIATNGGFAFGIEQQTMQAFMPSPELTYESGSNIRMVFSATRGAVVSVLQPTTGVSIFVAVSNTGIAFGQVRDWTVAAGSGSSGTGVAILPPPSGLQGPTAVLPGYPTDTNPSAPDIPPPGSPYSPPTSIGPVTSPPTVPPYFIQ